MAEDVMSTTLAYKKSPKTSKRTSFQDELQAAISARARKNNTEESYSYAEDFEDDDALEVLLNLRKKKIEMFKSGKKKAIDLRLPGAHAGEDRKSAKPKRVSFGKTRRRSSPPPGGLSDEAENGPDGGGSHSSRSDRSLTKSVQFSSWSRSRSESPPLSEERQEVFTSPGERWGGTTRDRQETVVDGERRESLACSEGRLTMTGRYEQEEAPNAEDQERLMGGEMQPPVPQPRERRKTPSSDSPFEEVRPKPRPRQRAPREGGDPEEESMAGGELQLSRPPTSSVSIPLSSAGRASSMSSDGQMDLLREPSPQRPGEDRCVSSSAYGQLPDSLSRSTEASDEAGFPKKGQQEEYGSTSFEDCQEGEDDRSDGDGGGQSRATEESPDPSSRTQSAKRPKSSRAQVAESRYLGALKVLDQVTTEPDKTEPDMADSVRAAVYQDWLKTKQKSTQKTLKVKKQEEQSLQEKKKQEEMSKKEGAKASFAAWSEKKTEALKAKVKEKQKVIQTQQEEVDQRVEKNETAKKVFEKWKTDQDKSLRDKCRQRKQAEQLLKQKKEEEEEERRKDCRTTFLKWSQVKEKVVHEQVRSERREEKIKEEEEKYVKEEKGKMALEMYEKWLRRKERQERRERNQRRVRAILQDEPPPPWSPPNKTIPFGR